MSDFWPWAIKGAAALVLAFGVFGAIFFNTKSVSGPGLHFTEWVSLAFESVVVNSLRGMVFGLAAVLTFALYTICLFLIFS